MSLYKIKSGTVIVGLDMNTACSACGGKLLITNGTLEYTNFFQLDNGRDIVARALRLLDFDEFSYECEHTKDSLPYIWIMESNED
jgi:hypothetical protein